jgi:signal transduction histidine kinase
MWVVAQLIERHRGHVSVWSTQRPGASGTVFSVFFPSGEAQESAKDVAVPAAESDEELITG